LNNFTELKRVKEAEVEADRSEKIKNLTEVRKILPANRNLRRRVNKMKNRIKNQIENLKAALDQDLSKKMTNDFELLSNFIFIYTLNSVLM
jgi:hypothetical protein